MQIKVLKNVMIKNNAIGNDNRDLFTKHSIFTINITSSPGAGKTTLLENSLTQILKTNSVAVIEGDLYTSRDADRLSKFDIPIVQINTEGGCHLDAKMINEACKSIDLENVDLLVIENVGNLVCPASFDLGEHLRVLIYSITEGVDKPAKYANMFKSAHAIIINKVDLADICKIDIKSLEEEVREINKTAKIFKTNSTDPNTLMEWNAWLNEKIKNSKKS